MLQSELHKPLGPWLYMLLDVHKLTEVAVDLPRPAAITGLCGSVILPPATEL